MAGKIKLTQKQRDELMRIDAESAKVIKDADNPNREDDGKVITPNWFGDLAGESSQPRFTSDEDVNSYSQRGEEQNS